MSRYYFFSNCSWQNKRVGNGYVLNGIFTSKSEKLDFNLISINPIERYVNNDEKNFFYKKKKIFKIQLLDTFLNFILSIFLIRKSKKQGRYILATSTLEEKNIFLIKKYNIKTYLMIDSIFDDYAGSTSIIRKTFRPFAFLIEMLYITSGLDCIILNSELASSRFYSRYKLFLKYFNVKVLSATIWIDQIASKKGTNFQTRTNNYLLIHGNFDFSQNLKGLNDFSLAVYKYKSSGHAIHNLNLVIAGKSAIKIEKRFINNLKNIFNTVDVISDPIVLDDLIYFADAVIIASTEANGPKIKVLESCLSGKITFAHKFVARYYPDDFPNLIVFDNYAHLINLITNTKNFINVSISNDFLDHWSKNNKTTELINKLNLC
jgi:hypothetical protein